MMQATSLPMPSPVAETSFQTSSEQSLGATILASGMLQKPRAGQRSAGADPPHDASREDRVLLVR